MRVHLRDLNGGRATPVETVRDVLLPGLLAEYERWTEYGVWAAHLRATGEFGGSGLPPAARRLGPRVRHRGRESPGGRGIY